MPAGGFAPAPGRLRTPPDRHHDRSARSSLDRGRGTAGAPPHSPFAEARPGAVPTRRASGGTLSRCGAPGGVARRSQGALPRLASAAQNYRAFRRSAPLEGSTVPRAVAKLGRSAPRERSLLCGVRLAPRRALRARSSAAGLISATSGARATWLQFLFFAVAEPKSVFAASLMASRMRARALRSPGRSPFAGKCF